MISRAANPEIVESVLGLICEDSGAARLAERNLSVTYQNSEAAKVEYKQAIESEVPQIEGVVEYVDNLVRWGGSPEPPPFISFRGNDDAGPINDVSATSAEIIRNYQLQRTIYFLYLATNSVIKQQKITPKDPAEMESARLLEKILYDAQLKAEKQTLQALKKLPTVEFVSNFDDFLSPFESDRGYDTGQLPINQTTANAALPLLSIPGIKLPQDMMEKEAVYARHDLEWLFWRSIAQNEHGPGKGSLNNILENTRLKFEVLDEIDDPKTVVGYYSYKEQISLYVYDGVPRVIEGRFVEITDRNEIIVMNRDAPTGFYAVSLLADNGKESEPFRAVRMEIIDDMREDYERDSTDSPITSILITPENPIGELTLNPGEATAVVTRSLMNLIESIVVIERLSHQDGHIVIVEYKVPNDIEWPTADPNFPLTIEEIKGLENLPGNEPKRKLLIPGGDATGFINVYANGILIGGYDIKSKGKIKFVEPDRSHKPVKYSN